MVPRKAQVVFLLGTLLLVRAAPCVGEQTITCESGTRSAAVSPVVPSVTLSCAETQELSSRTLDMKLCAHKGDTCTEDTVQNADKVLKSIGAIGTWSGNRLAVTQFPSKNEKISFICKKQQQATCTVVVDISKAAESCIREQSQAKDLNLTLSENETVYFRCPEEDMLSPVSAGLAYNGDCQGTATELPGELKRAQNDTTKAYSLTLVKSPAKVTSVCYKCGATASDTKAAENCFIKVTTQTTTQPPSGPPTSSGIATSQASIMLAWGIALATLRHT